MQIGVFRAGTSGISLEEPNKKAFPDYFQDKTWLVYYASLFNSLEINSSFYKIPQYKTYKKWAESVPSDFTFSIKLWRGFTHEEYYEEEDLKNFFMALKGLEVKKGCLLIQYPAKSRVSLQERGELLKKIRNLDPDCSWRLAIEIRNEVWKQQDFFNLLEIYHATLVIHDLPKTNLDILNVKSSFLYLRFHGPTGAYGGSYSDDFLLFHAARIRCWILAGLDIYIYFNNTIGDAVKNLKTLKSMVG